MSALPSWERLRCNKWAPFRQSFWLPPMRREARRCFWCAGSVCARRKWRLPCKYQRNPGRYEQRRRERRQDAPIDSSIARHATPNLELPQSLMRCRSRQAHAFTAARTFFIIYEWRLSTNRGLPSGLTGRVTLQQGTFCDELFSNINVAKAFLLKDVSGLPSFSEFKKDDLLLIPFAALFFCAHHILGLCTAVIFY